MQEKNYFVIHSKTNGCMWPLWPHTKKYSTVLILFIQLFFIFKIVTMFGFNKKSKSPLPSHHRNEFSVTSSSSAGVAVMAVALSLATYMYNSLIRLHGNTADPIVQTTLGLVQGNLQVSRDGATYFEFLGIPFAAPPIGDLRFEVRFLWKEII